MNTVDEPGLYRLILRSDKPEAEPFMEWITAEVLPTIRKTGSYLVPGASALDAMTTQLINMIVPAVISQATAAIVSQINPQLEGLQKRVDDVQINFSHYGTVWSFTHHCCQKGGTNTFVEKTELYQAYCDYCATIPYCRPDGKGAFLTKLYHGSVNTYSATITRFGMRVPVVRGIALLPGYETIIDDIRRRRQESDAEELARRRSYYFGIENEPEAK